MQNNQDEMAAALESALGNILITERIFNWAKFENKKSLRMLNQFWRNNTLDDWRTKTAIMLHDSNCHCRKSDSTFARRILLEDYIAIVNGLTVDISDSIIPFRLEDKPFRRIIICGGGFVFPPKKEVDSTSKSQIMNFLITQGPSLEYLKLAFGHNLSEFGIKWILLRACPNLRHLSVKLEEDAKGTPPSLEKRLQPLDSEMRGILNKISKIGEIGGAASAAFKLQELDIQIDLLHWSSDNIHKGEEIVRKILKLAANIKTLKIGRYVNHQSLNAMLSLLHKPEEGDGDGRLQNLEELDIDLSKLRWLFAYNMSYPPPNRWIGVPPSLKNLKIKVSRNTFYPSNETRYLQALFPKERSSLAQLEIHMTKRSEFCCNDLWLSDFRGYYFENLTHFKMHLEEDNEEVREKTRRYSVGFDFSVLEGMPNLEVFRYLDTICGTKANGGEDKGWKDIQVVQLPSFQLSKLQEFWFYLPYHPFNVKSLRIILNWMKDLKILALHLDNDTFPVVFEMLPNLERLILLNEAFKSKEEEKEGWMTVGTSNSKKVKANFGKPETVYKKSAAELSNEMILSVLLDSKTRIFKTGSIGKGNEVVELIEFKLEEMFEEIENANEF